MNGTFLSMTALDRFKLLSEWFNLEKYDNAIEHCKEQLKNINQKLESLLSIQQPTQNLKSIEFQKTETEHKIVNLKIKRAEFEKKQELCDNKKLIEYRLSEIDAQIEEAKANDENKTNKDKLNRIDFNQIEKTLETNKNIYVELDKKLKQDTIELEILKKKLIEKNGLLKQPLQCPKCKSHLLLKNKLVEFNKGDAETELNELKVKYIEINDSISINEKKIKELDLVINKDMELIEQIKYYDSFQFEFIDVVALNKERAELLTQFNKKDYSQDIASINIELETLHYKQGELTTLVEFVKRQTTEYDEAQIKIDELNKQKLLYELWGDYKTSKGLFSQIKGLILDKFLGNLQAITNLNLSELFLVNSKIEFEVTKKGIEITQNGHSISSMSSGEKARMAFSIAFALNQLYKNNLNILILDEFFSNLDVTGMQETIKILDKIKGTKFIISHVPCEADNVINLIKKNGVTYANTI